MPVADLHAIPRQIGIRFELPSRFTTLSRERDTQWTVYPDNHIGRPSGSATAHTADRDTTPVLRSEPAWPWSLDDSPLGTSDFRSTKHSVRRASLVSDNGRGLQLLSNGHHGSRCWLQDDRVHWLVTARDGAPSESFQDGFFRPRRTRLPLDAAITDTIRLRPTPGP